ncbi:MAG: adenylyltransferase/cytidyltransferase family protein [Planctomycetes bacterium]|nr:adenylyltransferase/cytidyltransferase family protein [Planctomycetota bacterium]
MSAPEPAKIIRDHAALSRVVEEHRAAGRRVVFTNGTFDLLHVGHLRSLMDARSRGDLLIVALNSDASVRSYKGPGLPIQPEDERAELIAGLRCVDYVTLFDEPRVDPLLARLRPHVHAKGTEYSPETLPEAETVRGYGGEIAIVGDPKAHSSSWLIARIRGAALP